MPDAFPFIPGVTESDSDNIPPLSRLVRAIAVNPQAAQSDIAEGVDKLRAAIRKVEDPDLRGRLHTAVALIMDGSPNRSRRDIEGYLEDFDEE